MADVKPRLGAAFLRLFTVQASWNYERLIGVGTGFAAEPLLRGLKETDEERYRAALGRASRYFNAHPYLSGAGAGALARAEVEGVPAEQVERLRGALAGPLGSIGDRLVWAGWLPTLSALAVAAVAWGAGMPAVAGFLLVYNVGHVALRWWALRAGWEGGVRVAGALQARWIRRAGQVLVPATALALGFALPLVAQWSGEAFRGWPRITLATSAAVAFGLLRWRPDILSGLRLGLVLVVIALVAGILWR
ncbi:MAG TPA: PTS system mannose/fructose/sorbose family transporter subunit IID [Gemmatimonadales bacterium]|jgi:PTS system mannose-specific IID component|nr:PTS system mannose/fructose/sorbose family transporter subunit IID [Gemmatimonadales bacterium]